MGLIKRISGAVGWAMVLMFIIYLVFAGLASFATLDIKYFDITTWDSFFRAAIFAVWLTIAGFLSVYIYDEINGI